MNNKIIILGAGIGGLSVGYKTDYSIIEKSSSLPMNFSSGVHYLHSVPEIDIGVNYKEIPLVENVYGNSKKISFSPSEQDCENYAIKIYGINKPTSIRSIGDKNFCYMPESKDLNDISMELAKECNISFERSCTDIRTKEKFVKLADGAVIEYDWLISTIPLSYLLKMCEIETKEEFTNKEIFTFNCPVELYEPDLVTNTYIPDSSLKGYRISMVGNQISLESSINMSITDAFNEINEIYGKNQPLGLDIEKGGWAIGKVNSISQDSRKRIIKELFSKNIISFGRFGLWNRRLLIDSTVKQANTIKQFLEGKLPEVYLFQGLI